ncbi:preprotein translocase subunit SecE [Thermodesulfobacteriota bacterium]
MKTTHKKRKKRGSRKTIHPKPESQIISKSDSSLETKEGDAKQKSQQVILKRAPEKNPDNRNQISKYINIATHFLRDAKMELKKVKWPTRKELLASTAVVIILVLVVSFFLGLIDFGLIKIIKKIVG